MLLLFDSDQALFEALLGGDVDAAAVDQVKASRWLAENPDALHRPFTDLFNKVAEAIALRRGDGDGLNYLDSWIAHHRTSGWLAERRAYWFESRDWAPLVADDTESVAACSASFTW